MRRPSLKDVAEEHRSGIGMLALAFVCFLAAALAHFHLGIFRHPLLCLATGIFAAGNALFTFRRAGAKLREYRSHNGLCASCGYNLTGNISGVCPECGTTITPIPPARP